MRRYWLNNLDNIKDSIEIEGEEFHHIFHVCRRDVGNKFEILFGDGFAYLVEVMDKKKSSASVKVLEKRELPSLKKPFIHLALSLPKPSTYERVLEKCVELGVKEIQPFISDNSYFKSKKHRALQKEKRWQKIITSATQQSGRAEKMGLNPVKDLQEVLDSFNQKPSALGLLAYEGEGALTWKGAVAEIQKKAQDEIWLFVGSEGGFSDREQALFKKIGLEAMTMGEQILRVETACVALISSLKYEMEI